MFGGSERARAAQAFALEQRHRSIKDWVDGSSRVMSAAEAEARMIQPCSPLSDLMRTGEGRGSFVRGVTDVWWWLQYDCRCRAHSAVAVGRGLGSL